MAVVIAVQCTVCGAATRVRPEAARQTCESCGAEFLYQATHGAAGDAERAVRARLDAIQARLDAFDAEARRCAAGGDLPAAYRAVDAYVRTVSAIYRETGYYRLMGIETEAEIERNLGFAFGLELERLGIPAPAAAAGPAPAGDAAGYAQMTQALAARDLDGAIAGYTAMVRAQLEHDPRWRERPPEECRQALVTAVRGFALGLPWATLEDLARHGIDPARPIRRADGSTAVTCAQCGAEVVLAHLAEMVTCAHCSATFRIHLEGVDAYHARGHTDVTAADLAAHNAAMSTDVPARLELGRQTVAGMELDDPVRARELTFVYALQLGVPLPAAAQATLAAQLELGPPRGCASCSTIVALAPGSRKCPLCMSPA